MAQKKQTVDKIKKFALGALLLVICTIVLYYIIFSGSSSSTEVKKSSDQTEQSMTARGSSGGVQKQFSPQDPNIVAQQLMGDSSPLDLSNLDREKLDKVEQDRNIFKFYVKPPPTPAPQPTPVPPPIMIRHVQPQTLVAGTPRNVTLVVSGQGFPADAQILLSGMPKETKQATPGELKTDITPSEYALARTVNVDVKSKNNPKEFWSNTVPLIIQASPDPPLKLIGRIGETGVFQVIGSSDVVRLKPKETFQGIWRIDQVNSTGVDLTDTRYDIKKHMDLEQKK